MPVKSHKLLPKFIEEAALVLKLGSDGDVISPDELRNSVLNAVLNDCEGKDSPHV